MSWELGEGSLPVFEGCESWAVMLFRSSLEVQRRCCICTGTFVVDGFGAVYRVKEIGGLAFEGAEMPAFRLGPSAASILH